MVGGGVVVVGKVPLFSVTLQTDLPHPNSASKNHFLGAGGLVG